MTRRTFWGEIAYQIGGREGYEAFRTNDEARVSPGKADLRAFLEAHQPFILLFDEILEYINRAQDVRERGRATSGLSTQTFSFFQELTEAVATLPYGMMVVTLPSSYLEDFGERRRSRWRGSTRSSGAWSPSRRRCRARRSTPSSAAASSRWSNSRPARCARWSTPTSRPTSSTGRPARQSPRRELPR